MRILFATPYYYPAFKFGGPPKKIHALSCGLAARGHQIHVLTFDFEKHNSRERTNIEGVEVQYLPWVGSGLKQMPLGLSFIKDSAARADAVQCYGIYNLLSPIVAYIALRLNRPRWHATSTRCQSGRASCWKAISYWQSDLTGP